MPFRIDEATEADVWVILSFVEELADYERLSHDVVATHDDIHAALFSDHPVAEAVIGRYDGEPVGFALFFSSFSTFLGRPGIYLEDLYVRPDYRSCGFGRRLLVHLARLAQTRAVAVWSGRSSIGTAGQSTRTVEPAPCRWTSGRCIA